MRILYTAFPLSALEFYDYLMYCLIVLTFFLKHWTNLVVDLLF